VILSFAMFEAAKQVYAYNQLYIF